MRLTDNIRDAVCRAVMQDTPRPAEEAYNNAQVALREAAAKSLHPKLRAVWDDVNLRDCLAKTQQYNGKYLGAYIPVGAKLTPEDIAAYDRARDMSNEEQKERTALSRKLFYTLKAFSTVKAAVKVLPELEKYFPTEAKPTKNLPAVDGVITGLTKLGWPKDKNTK